MGHEDGRERRQALRHAFVMRVTYADRKEFLSAWTENVSEGGLFVRTDHPFEVGQIVRASLSFPGVLEPLEVEGGVAWVREASDETGAGVGIKVEGEVHRRKLAQLALIASGSAEQATGDAVFRILVVEDNPMVTQAFSRALGCLGSGQGAKIEVISAGNGQLALETLRRGGVDLVITDLYMPVMDGTTLIRELRGQQETQSLPILAVTGAGEEESAQVVAAGADAVIHKPFRFGPMLETIVRLLGGR